jgi:aryl-alcohol dehydrogenase-like predicted oxidoreductase
MSLPQSAYVHLAPDLKICRILNGMGQLSANHGAVNPEQAIAEMFQYVDAGFCTWELADHYGPAEDFIGKFRSQWMTDRGVNSLPTFQALTQWVPRPGRMTRQIVESNIDVSLSRMNTDCIDLLQFHWWEYRDLNYLDALRHLSDLQAKGKIKQIGLANFDTKRLHLIINEGIKVVSNQVAFSLLDRRPLVKMTEFCKNHGISLLAYSSLCGGFMTERWIGAPEPRQQQLSHPSLLRAQQNINDWSGWRLFQELLLVLQSIARKHGVTLPNVALRYVLEQPQVGGVIVGTRLGRSQHVASNSRTFDFALDAEDYGKLQSIWGRSNDLYGTIGDCGDEYRN